MPTIAWLAKLETFKIYGKPQPAAGQERLRQRSITLGYRLPLQNLVTHVGPKLLEDVKGRIFANEDAPAAERVRDASAILGVVSVRDRRGDSGAGNLRDIEGLVPGICACNPYPAHRVAGTVPEAALPHAKITRVLLHQPR